MTSKQQQGSPIMVKTSAIYSALVGLVYIVSGVLEWLAYLKFEVNSEPIGDVIPLMGDIFMGFSLLLIGIIFLFGIRPLLQRDAMGPAYPLVGAGLGMVLAVMQLLIMVANWAEKELLENEDFADWQTIDDLTISVYVVMIAILALYPVFRREKLGYV